MDEAERVPDTVLTDVLLPMLTHKGGTMCWRRRRSVGTRRTTGSTRGLAGLPPNPKDGQPEQAITYEAFCCPTSDNPHLVHAFLEAQREELGESMYAQEFVAQSVDDFGAVFRIGDPLAETLQTEVRAANLLLEK